MRARGVDADDRVAEHELAVDALVERAVPDRQALDVELAAEEFLRERRALVGQGGLAADHHEAAGEAVAAQAVDDLRGGMAASGDDDRVLHARVPPLAAPLYTGAPLCGRECR